MREHKANPSPRSLLGKAHTAQALDMHPRAGSFPPSGFLAPADTQRGPRSLPAAPLTPPVPLLRPGPGWACSGGQARTTNPSSPRGRCLHGNGGRAEGTLWLRGAARGAEECVPVPVPVPVPAQVFCFSIPGRVFYRIPQNSYTVLTEPKMHTSCHLFK